MAGVSGDGGEGPPEEGPEIEEEEEQEGSGRPWLKLVGLVLLVAASLVVVRATPLADYVTRDGVMRGIEMLRGSPWAAPVFIAVYATATALAVPGLVLTLAGGALFGAFWGVVYNSLAANIGANAAFWIGRGLGREGVRRLAGDRLDRLDRATREHGFRGLLVLRLIPLVPFNALNFGSGLTSISWGAYAVATAVGILPGTIVYTLFADALLAGSTEASREAFVQVAVSGLLLVLLSFLPTLLKRMNVKLPGSVAVLLLLAGSALVRPLPTAGQSSGPTSLPDPAPFTAVLQQVVEGDRVDYAALQRRGDDLDAWLRTIANVPAARVEAAPREERLAFWINAYNACMLDLVAEHYPLERSGGLFHRLKNRVAGRPANSVWQIPDVFGREHCEVAGEPRSQDEIEHEILRPMGEPRIHFAVNCAALSCPPLADSAYDGEALDRQLDRQVRAFARDPGHFRLTAGESPSLTLNRVLEWFSTDFGGVEGLRDFFAPYLKDDAATLVLDPSTTIDFFEYDWTLNDTAVGGSG